MTLSRDLYKRLLMAKQILNHGLEHGSKNGEINRLYSIISLDGAIESILHTIITELGGVTKNLQFEAIFKGADQATVNTTKINLPYRLELLALHKARNAAQHENVIPDPSTIQRFKLRSEDFFSQVYENCFKISLAEVIMAVAIQDIDLRKVIGEAEDQILKTEFKESAISSAKAFELLKSKKEKQELKRGKLSSQNLDKIIKEIEYLKERIELLSLRVNFQDYLFFKKNTPDAATMSDGSMRFSLRNDSEYSYDNSTRVLNFVYDLIVNWEGSCV